MSEVIKDGRTLIFDVCSTWPTMCALCKIENGRQREISLRTPFDVVNYNANISDKERSLQPKASHQAILKCSHKTTQVRPGCRCLKPFRRCNLSLCVPASLNTGLSVCDAHRHLSLWNTQSESQQQPLSICTASLCLSSSWLGNFFFCSQAERNRVVGLKS